MRFIGLYAEILRKNSQPELNKKSDRFTAVSIPEISLVAYLNRFYLYYDPSDDFQLKQQQFPMLCLIVLIYLDRLQIINARTTVTEQKIILNSYTVHRLFTTCFLIACKMHTDIYLNNASFALIAGLSLVEINELEVFLLFFLDFNFNVSQMEFNNYIQLWNKEFPNCRILEHSTPSSVEPYAGRTGVHP